MPEVESKIHKIHVVGDAWEGRRRGSRRGGRHQQGGRRGAATGGSDCRAGPSWPRELPALGRNTQALTPHSAQSLSRAAPGSSLSSHTRMDANKLTLQLSSKFFLEGKSKRLTSTLATASYSFVKKNGLNYILTSPWRNPFLVRMVAQPQEPDVCSPRAKTFSPKETFKWMINHMSCRGWAG